MQSFEDFTWETARHAEPRQSTLEALPCLNF